MSQASTALDSDRYEFASDFLARLGQTRPGALVYDLGAGEGMMRAPAEEAGLTWRGFDLSPKRPEVQRWDLSEPCPADGDLADAVIMLDVVEHLFNPGIAMKNIARSMRPGGNLLLTMPNPCWSRSRVHHLVYGRLAAFTEHDLEWNHHVFVPFPHIIERLLADAGFEITGHVTLDGRTSWPRPRSLAYPLLVAEAAGRKLLERADPGACGFSYAVTATRH